MTFRILLIILFAIISEVNAQKYPHTMQVDLSLLLGESVLPAPGMQVFNGVRIDKQKIEAGITAGIDVYSQFTVVPVSGSIKWMPLPKQSVIPYVSVNAGYGLAWFNGETEIRDYRGGIHLNPMIGLRFKSKSKTKLNFGIGYKHQEASIVETNTDGLGRLISQVAEKYKLRRVSVNFGVSFF